MAEVLEGKLERVATCRGFLLTWEDVPYILIKVDPKPQEAGKHNSKPRRKKGKNYVLISPYFPRGFFQNGTLSCSRTKALLKLLSVFCYTKRNLVKCNVC